MLLWVRLILGFFASNAVAMWIPWKKGDTSGAASQCPDSFKATCLADAASCASNCGNDFAWDMITRIQNKVKGNSKLGIAIAIVIMVGLIAAYCFIVGRVMKLIIYFFISVSVFCVAVMSTPFLKNWAITQLTRTAD